MGPDACRIREYTPRGYHAVALEHEHLSVVVLPDKGAEIFSIIYRPRDFDLLWKAPWGLHRPNAAAAARGGSEAAWMDAYGGGWQIIFPNGGDACEVNGAHLGFHSEASTAEWDYTCNAIDSGATVWMSVSLPRTPFYLTREVAIEQGSLSVVVRESAITDAERGFFAMWGQHPALASKLICGARVEVPAAEYVPHSPELSETARMLPGERHPWPIARAKDGSSLDFSRLPAEEDRRSEMGYLTGLDEGRLRIQNERVGMGKELSWDKAVFPCVWYWLEWGGLKNSPWFGRGRVTAFEPFSSMPGCGLANAVNTGSALHFAQGERHGTEVRFTVLPAGI